MALQTGKNFLVAYKAETVFNTPPSAGSANVFRANASQGSKLERALINSNEIRGDGMTSMARLGSKKVSGTYGGDLSVGTFEPLLEAVMRGTWASTTIITQAAMTSITQTANSIVATAGSWITQGVRVGDVLKQNVTGGPGGNNNRNLRVTSVSALTLGIAETLIVDATPRTTFGITVAKKLIQPSTPVRRSFTFEEYNADLDLTKQATGCRISSVKITGQPDGMCLVEFTIVGADLTPLGTGASPFYTSPTVTSTIGLVWTDATLRFGGVDVTNLTAFELTIDMKAQTQPVIGSNVTPDVFEGNTEVTGSISGIRADFSNLTRFTSETELEFHAMLVEPESEPKDFTSIFLPRIKLTGVDDSFGNDGAIIETLPFMAGPKGVATGYDNTMVSFQSSAP